LDRGLVQLCWCCGGPDYDWTLPSKDYPEDTAAFIEKICEEHRAAEDNLNIPDVRIENFNPEQRLAFDTVVKTLLDHERNVLRLCFYWNLQKTMYGHSRYQICAVACWTEDLYNFVGVVVGSNCFN
jgi:hypothetical protein